MGVGRGGGGGGGERGGDRGEGGIPTRVPVKAGRLSSIATAPNSTSDVMASLFTALTSAVTFPPCKLPASKMAAVLYAGKGDHPV